MDKLQQRVDAEAVAGMPPEVGEVMERHGIEEPEIAYSRKPSPACCGL